MMRLLSIEFSKVRNYPTFWILMGVYLLLAGGFYYMMGLVATSEVLQLPLDYLYGFPKNWNTIAFCASYSNILMGIVLVIIISNDYRFKTQRQNVIDGLSKRDVIMSKVYFALALSIVLTLIMFLVGLLVGLAFESESGVFEGVEYIGMYFVQTIGYLMIAFVIAIIFKKPAMSIIFYVLFFWIPGIMSLFIPEVVEFFPTRVIGSLTPAPLFSEFTLAAQEQNPDAEMPYMLSEQTRWIMALVWTALFVFLSFIVLKRRDL